MDSDLLAAAESASSFPARISAIVVSLPCKEKDNDHRLQMDHKTIQKQPVFPIGILIQIRILRQSETKKAVLRIRDVYPGPEFFHPNPEFRVKKIPDP
jgi:hypothetical protein